MPPRRRQPPKTPVISRLQKQGMNRWEIMDRLNGPKNGRDLTRRQYSAMGFNDWRVDRFMQQQRSGPSRGGGGGGAGSNPGTDAPVDGPVWDEEDDPFNQSAYDIMRGLLEQYGLGSLAGQLRNLVEQGITDQASLTLALQDTAEWKQRFAGNEALRGRGLPVLSVAEYLATERSMAQIMRNFGLPDGFYDGPDDFAKFIGNAVSPAELQERVQSYSDLANREDPAVKAQLRAMGMSEGDLLAFYMDPDRANPLIQRKYKATLIGASARRAGLVADNAYAERLAGMGITEQQAQAGYAAIGDMLPTLDKLGDIYGQDYDQADAEAEVFEGNAGATRKRKRLASQERAAFSGSSGVSQGSLRRSTGGQF